MPPINMFCHQNNEIIGLDSETFFFILPLVTAYIMSYFIYITKLTQYQVHIGLQVIWRLAKLNYNRILKYIGGLSITRSGQMCSVR